MTDAGQNKKYDLLAFGAHPDDVEVGCGGLIIKMNKLGYKSALAIFTQGEMGTGGTPAIRAEEVKNAAKIMGADIVAHLDLGDCRLEDNFESRLAATEIIRRHRPSIVFAPWWTGGHGKRQSHPDHLACGRIAVNAVNYATFKKLPIDLPRHRVNALFHYMLPPETPPTFVVDITDEYDQWIEALSAHRSQFLNPEKDRDYLWSLESMARTYGNLIGVKYGQGFAIGEPLKIANPFCLVGTCARLPELLIEKKTSDEE
jgi:bacillithiol biosynthesis deacetylase BshB1